MDNSYSQYAEIGVLSIIIKNPELAKKASENIKSFMFTSVPNKTIFSVISQLDTLGIVPDFGTIISHLQANNSLASCGGENYLKYLASQEYNPINLDELSKFILNSYKSRELISLSANLTNLATTGDVDNTISYLREFLDNLSSHGAPEDISSMESATDAMMSALISRLETGVRISATTGLSTLDNVTGGYGEGELWAIAGRPGMGKSAFMCNSVLSGVPSLVFSKEMSKESLIHRLVAIYAGLPVFNLRLGAITQNQLEIVKDAVSKIKEFPIFIDTSFNSSVEHIVGSIIKYRSMYGIRVVHVDYLQLLSERGDDSTNELGRITRNLKLLSNNLNITTVVYSQLNRLVESRQDKRPILSDFRQSGNIEEDIDVGMFLYRDVLYNTDTAHKTDLELIIRKQRNGPTGTLLADFDDVTNKIKERNVK